MVAARLELAGESCAAAAAAVLDGMPPESGGLIAVDRGGRVALSYTSQGMYRGWATESGDSGIGI